MASRATVVRRTVRLCLVLLAIILSLALLSVSAAPARDADAGNLGGQNAVPARAELSASCFANNDAVELTLSTDVLRTDSLTISCAPDGAVVTRVDVHVSLDHDCSHELNIRLDNTVIHSSFLQERSCVAQDSPMELDFTSHAYDGDSPNDTWSLYLRDSCPDCHGTWNGWSITVYYVVPTSTATPSSTATLTRTGTSTGTSTLTSTPTATRTSTATSTTEPMPTGTATPTSTGTTVPPTITPTLSQTVATVTSTATMTEAAQPSSTATVMGTPTETSGWTFEGQVLIETEGEPVAPSEPVTVLLCGSDDPATLGERLMDSVTQDEGWFTLRYEGGEPGGLLGLDSVPRYMNLSAGAIGYVLVGGWSESGAAWHDNGYIQFDQPSEGVYPGNQMRLAGPPEPSATPTASPSTTLTPTSTETVTATPTGTPTLVLCADQDTYVDEASPDTNYGSLDTLRAGYGQGVGEPYARRVLLLWDLNFIPGDATIHSARLELQQTFGSGLDPVELQVYRLLDAWDETTVAWNGQPMTMGAMATKGAIPAGSPQIVTFDVTQVVREWLTGITPNNGLQLRGPEGGSSWQREFDSALEQTGFCPRLVLEIEAGTNPIPSLTPTTQATATPTATQVCPYPDEDNDSPTGAPTIVLSTDTNGYICPSMDHDYWRFAANRFQRITVGLENPPGNPPGVPQPNYDLCLVRPDGSVAQCSKNLNASYGEYLSMDADQTGQWSASVFGAGAADWNKTQPYTLTVVVCDEPDEAADNFEYAKLIKPSVSQANVSNPVDAYLCPKGDEDWFKVSIPANMVITITASLKNLPANYDLYLYAPTGYVRSGSVTAGTADESLSYKVNNEPGEWRIRVAPTYLGDHHATQTYTLDVDLIGVTRDFTVESWEVTQAIQNLANDVKLVTDKPTYVRVYGRQLSGPAASSVECELHGESGGATLSGSPLKPIRGNTVMGAGVTMDRGQDSEGWLFKLPASWTQEGSLKLRAVVDPRGLHYESNLLNNQRTGTFYFQKRAPICEVFVPVRTHAPAPSTQDKNFKLMVERMERLWPVPAVWTFKQNSDVAELETCWWGIIPYPCYGEYELSGGSVFDEDSWKILLALWNRDNFSDDPDQCDDIGARTHYVGMVHNDTPTNGQNGSGLLYSAHAWVKLPHPSATPPPGHSVRPWAYPAQGAVLAHELTHNYNIGHVDCGGAPDPDYYPYPVCALDNTGVANHYGFDTGSLSAIAPERARDYMAYGTPRWVSDYRWDQIFSKVGAPSGGLAGESTSDVDSLTLDGLPNLLAAETMVMVSGAISETEIGGTLEYAWAYPSAAQSAGIAGKWQALAGRSIGDTELLAVDDVHLRLIGAGEDLLDDIAITPQVDPDSPEQVARVFAQTFVAPTDPVQRLELLVGETVVDTLSPSAHTPVVTVTQPMSGTVADDSLTINWTATDADGGQTGGDHRQSGSGLQTTIQYSPDLGENWYVIQAGIAEPLDPGPNALTLDDLSGLPGSTTGALIRVATSDGYNTGMDTSDPFLLLNRAPEPWIGEPQSVDASAIAEAVGDLAQEDDGGLPAGGTILISGGASDTEQGALEGESLEWTLDGAPAGAPVGVPVGAPIGVPVGAPIGVPVGAPIGVPIGVGDEIALSGLAPGEYELALIATDDHENSATVTTTLVIETLTIPSVGGLVLDGVGNEAEYDVTPLVQLSDYGDGSSAMVRLARQSDELWLSLSGLAYAGDGISRVGVLLDGDGSGDGDVQETDRAIWIDESGQVTVEMGDGAGGWLATVDDGAIGVVSLTEGGWSAELAIDIGSIGGLADPFALALAHVDVGDGDVMWPHAVDLDGPDTWADARFEETGPRFVWVPVVMR